MWRWFDLDDPQRSTSFPPYEKEDITTNRATLNGRGGYEILLDTEHLLVYRGMGGSTMVWIDMDWVKDHA